jgi:putative exporter of polyketide antibiotics
MPTGIKNKNTPVSNGSVNAAQNTTRFTAIIRMTLAILNFSRRIRKSESAGIKNRMP